MRMRGFILNNDNFDDAFFSPQKFEFKLFLFRVCVLSESESVWFSFHMDLFLFYFWLKFDFILKSVNPNNLLF